MSRRIVRADHRAIPEPAGGETFTEETRRCGWVF